MTVTERRKQQARQGRVHVEWAADCLYQGQIQAESDRYPWPADLAQAQEILRLHLKKSRDELLAGGRDGEG